ncbi:hypothetical protein IRT45_21430 [Nocardia sp. BSTN01]|uniref:DUF6881 domain-containing protein n=1 Tax=Nocardia sp. BSTN01 TaxID=2783665 RepID=UPI00188FEDF8|nr:hypothetical protein [Nocardia sp. BSTN01]MBF4999710.1 hypothetical protein [Nocardia sp. BSTN01]
MIEERQLLNDIVAKITADVQPGWTEIKVRFDIVGTAVNLFAYAERESGTSTVVGFPREVIDLRQAMYVPGRGTWFTMWLSITADHKINVRFSRERPHLRRQLADPLLDDLRLYPRDSISEWMRAELGDRLPIDGIAAEPVRSACCKSDDDCDCIDRAQAIERAAGFVPEQEVTRHLKVVHYSEFDHIAVSFSEILSTGHEWRRVELFRDGGSGLAAVSGGHTEFTRLSGRMPSATEISDLPHLSAEEITPVEFQTEWLSVGGW